MTIEMDEKLIKEVQESRENIWGFITKHCTTYNVESKQTAKIPDFKYLKNFIYDLESHNRVIEAKARQLIISTVGMAYALHKLYYAPTPWIGKVITTPDLYYNGTYESLFGRIEFMQDHMPEHIKQSLVFTKRPAIIKNKRNGNILLSSTTTTKAGRGGTYDWVWVDEAAILGYMLSEILASTIPNSEKSVIVSTPMGKNLFYVLVKNAKEGKNGYYLREDDWTARPDHDKEWFEKKTKTLTTSQIAQEYLLSFETSQEGRVFKIEYPEKMLTNIDAYALYEKYGELYGGVDYGLSDSTVFIVGIYDRVQNNIYIPFVYETNNKLPEQIYKELIEMYKENFHTDNKTAEKMLIKTRFFGDPSGNNRNIETGKTLQSDYQNLGLRNLTNASRMRIIDGIKETQRWISNNDIKININASNILETLISCHYPINQHGIVTSYEKYADPGNFNVHIMDALRYLLQELAKPVGETEELVEEIYEETMGVKTLR